MSAKIIDITETLVAGRFERHTRYTEAIHAICAEFGHFWQELPRQYGVWLCQVCSAVVHDCHSVFGPHRHTGPPCPVVELHRGSNDTTDGEAQ